MNGVLRSVDAYDWLKVMAAVVASSAFSVVGNKMVMVVGIRTRSDADVSRRNNDVIIFESVV